MEKKGGLTRLPAFGGGRSAVADLNGDGYPEIVFCNYIHNYPGNRTAYVYWGGVDGYKADRKTGAAHDLGLRRGGGRPEQGWVSRADLREPGGGGGCRLSLSRPRPRLLHLLGRRTGFDATHPALLPTRGRRDVAVADVNHDGHLDLRLHQQQPRGASTCNSSWAAHQGTPPTAQTVPLADPTSLRSGDVNGDGYQDLVVATAAKSSTIALEGCGGESKGQHLVHIFLGDAGGSRRTDGRAAGTCGERHGDR